jgi:hypothetical protein
MNMNMRRVIIGMIIGILLGILGVALANYVSQRFHCYAGQWTPKIGWVCKIPRPD